MMSSRRCPGAKQRDRRRSCGGVPMYANTDVAAFGLAVPPSPVRCSEARKTQTNLMTNKHVVEVYQRYK